MPRARLAIPSELDLALAITREAFEPYVPELGGPPVPLTAEYGPAIASGWAWLVFGDAPDAPASGLAVLQPEADHLEIVSLAVRPAAQGQGLGRWMLDFAEGQARERGLSEIRLYTHERMTRNQVVYGKAGYRETGRSPNPLRPGWVAVHMAKRLSRTPAAMPPAGPHPHPPS